MAMIWSPLKDSLDGQVFVPHLNKSLGSWPVGSSSNTCLARRYFKPVEHKMLMDSYGKSAVMRWMNRSAVSIAAAASLIGIAASDPVS